MYYIALIHKETSSDYGVSFPDFPGCITAGESMDDAKNMASEALQFHIDGMIDDGETIPSPMPIEEVMHYRENKDAVAFLVEVQTPEDKFVRVNITIAEGLLKKATSHASQHGQSRSAFIAEAIKDALQHPKT